VAGLGEFEGAQWLCSNSLPSQCPPLPVRFIAADDESQGLLSDRKKVLPSLDELETQVRQQEIWRAAMKRQLDSIDDDTSAGIMETPISAEQLKNQRMQECAELVRSQWTAKRHFNGLNKSIHSSVTRYMHRPQLLSAALSMKLTVGKECSTVRDLQRKLSEHFQCGLTNIIHREPSHMAASASPADSIGIDLQPARHGKEKKFSCPECQQRFSQKSNMTVQTIADFECGCCCQKHWRSKHGGEINRGRGQ
jgi:hypothetical protein